MKTNAAKPVLPTGPESSDTQGRPQARRNAPAVALSTTDQVAELLIYGDIGDFFGMGIAAADVVEQLGTLGPDVKSLNVRLNSDGGDVFAGAAIYNALARLRIPVDVHIDGSALSIASIVAMAGDTITMASGTAMMIHTAWRTSVGNSAKLRSDADVLDLVNDGMMRIYTARTGQPEALITELMDAETWLSAEEALALGFCDFTDASVTAAARADLSKYRYHNTPKAWAEAPPPPPVDYRAQIAALAQRAASI